MVVEVVTLPWDSDTLDAFAPSVAANPWGWGTVGEVLDGAYAFEYVDGRQRAMLAVRPVVRSEGVRLDVVALASLGERIRAESIDTAMLDIARRFGARGLAMSTLRPHVAAAAQRTGWKAAGQLMTKRLDLQ